MREARAQMAANPQLSSFMDSLRGTNMDQSDFAAEGQKVNLMAMEVDPSAEDALPLVYCPDAISAYWDVRPVSVISRIVQLLAISGDFLVR